MERSTVPTVKAQLVDRFTTVLAAADEPDVAVTYAWPGPATGHEAVFLGRHPDLDDLRVDVTHDIPTIKAARKQRDETYRVEWTIWTFRPDLSSDGAQTCEARAFDLLAPIEDVFADDPTIGLGPTVVKWVELVEAASTLFPFQKGWACELLCTADVRARLQ